jgi:hypothetical protein
VSMSPVSDQVSAAMMLKLDTTAMQTWWTSSPGDLRVYRDFWGNLGDHKGCGGIWGISRGPGTGR